jgi:hypothetical protein
MRNFFIVLLGVQAALICGSIWQLTQGNYILGLFNIVLNVVFGYLNYCSIKKFKK